MSTDVVQRTPQQELMLKLEGENFQKALVALLPENVTPDRFRRVFGTALMATPEIAEAEPTTIMMSLLRIAEMGLLPNGREAAIVVRRNTKKGIKEAHAQPMIDGVRKRFAEHGWILRTNVVYEGDDFAYTLAPIEQVTKHDRARPGAERGKLVYAYATAKHRDGRVETKVIGVEEIETAKASGRTGPGTPWDTHEPAMWEKTAGHRLAKQVGLADDDRIVAMFAPPANGYEAAKEVYGPDGAAALKEGETVDTRTGEISSAAEPIPTANGPTDGGARTPDPQQAEEAETRGDSVDASSLSPAASSVPEDDDPEPLPVAEGGDAVIPGGAYEGRTLAEVAALGAEGEEYLAWMARNAGRSSVGPQVHAALQKFRPQLFASGS